MKFLVLLGVLFSFETMAIDAEEVFKAVNSERTSRGMKALASNEDLNEAAQVHTDNMVRFNQMSHTLPRANYPTLTSRLGFVDYFYTRAAENIAWNYRSVASLVRGWMTSAGHRANILNPYLKETGVALSYSTNKEPFYCQVFGSRN